MLFPANSAPKTGSLLCLIKSTRFTYCTFIRASEPMVACTTLGLYTSTVSSEQMIFLMPNQSAVRIIVPKLPGSWMPSNTKTKLCCSVCVSILAHCGIFIRAITSCGVVKLLIFSRLLSDVSWKFIFRDNLSNFGAKAGV